MRILPAFFLDWFKPRAFLIAENLCLRHQLVMLERKQKRPSIRNRDRWFWILMSRWFPCWRECLVIVTPETVLRWHRRGYRAYWRWRSRKTGRRRISHELRIPANAATHSSLNAAGNSGATLPLHRSVATRV